MSIGTAFGKTILIGDQFVMRGVPAIVSALPYETEVTVERIDGEGWILEDNAGMRNIIETIGGTPYKRYRFYEKDLICN